jgi:hypothetical protein
MKGVALSGRNFLSSMDLRKNFLAVTKNTEQFPIEKISLENIHSCLLLSEDERGDCA